MTDARTHRQATQRSFGRVAEHYVTSATHGTGTDLDRVVALSEPRRGVRALDVASGGGHTARVIGAAGAAVTATDLTVPMLQAARAHFREQALHIPVCAADAERLPFASGAFALVTCRIAPHHFHAPARFVQEAARVLKTGGLFVLEDHRAPDDRELAVFLDALERRRDPTHVKAYTEAQWCAWCAEAGLTVEHTERHTKVHNFADWCARVELSPAETAALEAAFLGGPPQAAQALRYVVAAGRLQSWANVTLILRARRTPAPG